MERVNQRHVTEVFGIPAVTKEIIYNNPKENSSKDKPYYSTFNKTVRASSNHPVHITKVFGYPAIKTFITDVSPEDSESTGIENCSPVQACFKHVIIAIALVLMCMLLPMTLIYVIKLSYPVDIQLHQLQTSVNQCESNKKIVSDALSTCSEDKTKLNDSFNSCSNVKDSCVKDLAKAKNRISTLEENLQTAEEKILNMEKAVKDLQSNVDSLKMEKQVITKKLEDTKFEFGKCQNKNMDHEISNSEILVELEECKKELKKC